MGCSSCKIQLPVGVAYCPNCGAVTPYKIYESGVAPNDRTVASSFYSAPLQAPPPPTPTQYGSPPYGVLQPNPYEPLNPYAVPLKAPPPPQFRRQLWRRFLVVLGSVCGVVLIAFGVIVFFFGYQEVTSPLSSDNSIAPISFIISGISIIIGAFIFCKSAVAMIGRYMAVISILVAAIFFISGFFLPNHATALGNFIGGGVIILLGGILFWGTRIRKW